MHISLSSRLHRETLPIEVSYYDKKYKVPPRFELGSLDTKSRVLTITPRNPDEHLSLFIHDENDWVIDVVLVLFLVST